MQSLSRRLFLRNTAAAGAMATTLAAPVAAEAVAVVDAPAEENPTLVAAWKEFRAAETEQRAAESDWLWIADEWKHLWPLAPEPLLGHTNAHKWYPGTKAEKDILGRCLHRDTSDLTTRLSARLRAANPRQCFSVASSAELVDEIERTKARLETGRTENARQRSRKAKAKRLRELRVKLPLARRYEAETAHLRELAGVAKADERLRVARNRVVLIAERVSREQPTTLYGLRLHADAVIYTLENCKITEGSDGLLGQFYRLACDVMRATEHLKHAA